MLLSSLLFIPLLGILLICAGRSHERSMIFALSASEGWLRPNKTGASSDFAHSSRGHSFNTLKLIALGTSILNLIISLIIYISFDFSSNQFQFVQEYHDMSFFDIYLGIDGLSIYFVLLTTIIMPIALLSNWNSITENITSYLIIMLLLETLLLAVFLVLDILLFYIFFESILPPLFLLIGLFGSGNKVRASFYIFLYTLGSSLFLLLAILTMSSIMGTTDFDALFKTNFDYTTQLFIFCGVFIAIAVKTPTIFLNNWLLRAHVESPLGGSIVLAAIVLKLSLYGIFRLILPILPKASLNYTYIVYLIGVITIIYASFSTLRTTDVKELIAYSSVSHAAVYLIAEFSNTIQGIEGSILLGLGHGFVSSALFICVGGILYDRSGTRNIAFYRGMTQLMPLFSIFFFIFVLANCGTPLTLNFVGEFMSLYGAFERLPLLGALAASSIVLSAAYSIYMFNRVAFGGSFSKFFEENISDLTKREFTILSILAFFTILFGIYPSFILDGLHYSVSTLIYSVDASSMEASSFLICGLVFTKKISLVGGLTRTFGLKKGPSTLLLLNSVSLCISSKSCLNSLLSKSYSSATRALSQIHPLLILADFIAPISFLGGKLNLNTDKSNNIENYIIILSVIFFSSIYIGYIHNFYIRNALIIIFKFTFPVLLIFFAIALIVWVISECIDYIHKYNCLIENNNNFIRLTLKQKLGFFSLFSFKLLCFIILLYLVYLFFVEYWIAFFFRYYIFGLFNFCLIISSMLFSFYFFKMAEI